MKVGDLVKYVNGVEGRYLWHQHKIVDLKTAPAIIIGEINERGTTTRRFTVRWHSGIITDEWISYLELYAA